MANQRGSPAQCTTHDNMAWQHAREAITKHMQRENTERKKNRIIIIKNQSQSDQTTLECVDHYARAFVAHFHYYYITKVRRATQTVHVIHVRSVCFILLFHFLCVMLLLLLLLRCSGDDFNVYFQTSTSFIHLLVHGAATTNSPITVNGSQKKRKRQNRKRKKERKKKNNGKFKVRR